MPYFIFGLFVFIFGTVIGSFLNVVILRLPKKQQIVKGRSHCTSCGHDLAWYDLFPLLSWVLLRGKCRYCKDRVSPRYAVVESLCGGLYALAFAVFGLTWEFAFAVALFPVLICLSFFDIDTGEIEYWCPLTVAALGVIQLFLSLTGVIEGATWSERLLGAVIIALPFAVLSFFGAMGGADVQLMAAAGLLLGFNIIPAALIGVIAGAIFGIVRKMQTPMSTPELPPSSTPELPPEPQLTPTGEPASIPPAPDTLDTPEAKGTVMAFGPFLAAGIAVAYLFGDALIGWYLSLMP